MMHISVIKPGLLTSLQDAGRNGLMHLGICQGGAMDPLAMRAANWLVRNPANAPVIEVTLIGPSLKFSHPVSIGIAGAQFDVFINGKSVDSSKTIQINANDQLDFGRLKQGARAYLAFSAKVNIKKRLESYSTHFYAKFGGIKGKEFGIGTKLKLIDSEQVTERELPIAFRFNYSGHYMVRTTPAIESELFGNQLLDLFHEQTYQLSPHSNRMGIRLKGQPISTEHIPPMVSAGLVQGSIQVPRSGQPIISSIDGQTIGGYPRIANVISADLHLLGQLKPGDKVNLTSISLDQAEYIFHQKAKLLEQLNG